MVGWDRLSDVLKPGSLEKFAEQFLLWPARELRMMEEQLVHPLVVEGTRLEQVS